MALVIILIILGIFLLGVEVFLLPGITVAGIGALISCGFGIYEAFVKYGNAGGFIALAAVLVLSVIMLAMGLRAKTWKRLALHNNIDGASQPQKRRHNGTVVPEHRHERTKTNPNTKQCLWKISDSSSRSP